MNESEIELSFGLGKIEIEFSCDKKNNLTEPKPNRRAKDWRLNETLKRIYSWHCVFSWMFTVNDVSLCVKIQHTVNPSKYYYS